MLLPGLVRTSTSQSTAASVSVLTDWRYVARGVGMMLLLM